MNPTTVPRFTLVLLIVHNFSTGSHSSLLSLESGNVSGCLASNVGTLLRHVSAYTTEIILDNVVRMDISKVVCSSIVKTKPSCVYDVNAIDNNTKPNLFRYKDTLQPQCILFSVLFVYTRGSEACPTVEETVAILNNLRALYWKRPRARFTLLLLTKSACNDVRYVFKQLTSFRFFPLVIVTFSSEDYKCNIVLHTYNYFNDSYTRTRDLGGMNPFPTEFRKLHGFPLKVGAVSDPPDVNLFRDNVTGLPTNITGFDVNLLRVISEGLGMTLNFVPRSDEADYVHLPNGTRFGLIMDLIEQVQDVNVNSFYIYHYDYKFCRNLEMSMPYGLTRLCAVVPKSEELDVVSNLDKMEEIVGLGLIIILVFTSLSFVLHKVESISAKLPSKYVNLLGNGRVPLFSKWPRRFILVAWILSCTSLFTEFQSKLADSLIYGVVPRDIVTLKELEASGRVPLMTIGNFVLTFDNSGETVDHLRRLRDRTRITRDKVGCIERLLGADRTNLTCVMESTTARSFLNREAEGKGRLIAVKECFFERWKGFLFTRDSYLLAYVNKIILWLRQAGLVQKLISDNANADAGRRTRPTVTSLSLANLQTTLLTIGGLYCTSIFIFLLEIVISRCQRRNKVRAGI